ncbi:MAG: hypothetical protein DWQ35_23140 [Planctomycetota bacterium]|nr:MAG: hypothetical protein DWQ35_23140 [Planctomycetota bacterium]REK23302.1 MAG: hypothetical protein DWQ42_15580 [Planctomycetota bacterium]REK39214.1 MAG: hypothetical protein DWQ46_18180 [Planctomycetota bacterium]
MAFRFSLNGTSVECDTADELQAALGMSTNSAASKTPARKTGKKRRTKKKAARKTTKGKQGSAASRSWAEAKREAKRQGRTDVAKVRSELAAAKAE